MYMKVSLGFFEGFKGFLLPTMHLQARSTTSPFVKFVLESLTHLGLIQTQIAGKLIKFLVMSLAKKVDFTWERTKIVRNN